jgi:hypothetical protein
LPGVLAINGDCGGYMFSRVEDMFEFFRARSGWNGGTINPQYWAEKLRGTSQVKDYSESKFRRLVAEHVGWHEDEYPGLRTAVKRRVLDEDLSFEENAREALRDFVHGKPPVWPEPDRRFRFEDTWEWDLTDWSYHYLWSCHAIQWGIDQYDAHKAAQLAAVGV